MGFKHQTVTVRLFHVVVNYSQYIFKEKKYINSLDLKFHHQNGDWNTWKDLKSIIIIFSYMDFLLGKLTSVVSFIHSLISVIHMRVIMK
jgi:hypothetical protein